MKKPTKPLPYEMNPYHVFSAFNEPVASAMAQSTAAFAKGMQSLQDELADFTAKRLRHDAETFYESTHCENIEEFTKIQQNWLSKTAEDYMEEAGRVMGLSQSLLAPMSEAGKTWAEGEAESSGQTHSAGASARRRKSTKAAAPRRQEAAPGPDIDRH